MRHSRTNEISYRGTPQRSKSPNYCIKLNSSHSMPSDDLAPRMLSPGSTRKYCLTIRHSQPSPHRVPLSNTGAWEFLFSKRSKLIRGRARVQAGNTSSISSWLFPDKDLTFRVCSKRRFRRKISIQTDRKIANPVTKEIRNPIL